MKRIAATAVLVAAAVQGQAVERIAMPGPYLGVNLGYATGSVSISTTEKEVCQGDPTCYVANSTADEEVFGVKAFGGYLFNQYFAVEGGYFNLGELSFKDVTNTGEVYKGKLSGQGINMDGLAHLPLLDALTVFARIGVLYAGMSKNYTYSGGILLVNGAPKDMHVTEWDVGYKLGAGVQYDFTPALGVRAEWEGYHLAEAGSRSDYDVNLYSLGVVYRFGIPEPEPEKIVVVKEVPVPGEGTVLEKEVVKEVEVVKKVEVIKEVPKPVIIKKPTERVVLASDTLFDFDKSNVKAEGDAALKQLSGRLQKNDRLVVVGHTDSVGTEVYNMKLSQRRANAVRSRLITLGISPRMIETRAMGESQPVATNATDEGRTANRRVEIEVYAAPKKEL
ncbi:OmpA family protein [Sulfurimonas diazotrophicus]|uniref:OmpA family protein n=1 Tax=Sulfurimonas diazotrophicus TaxID=3131939 RepID=A0ABZ3HBX5_9BACT